MTIRVGVFVDDYIAKLTMETLLVFKSPDFVNVVFHSLVNFGLQVG